MLTLEKTLPISTPFRLSDPKPETRGLLMVIPKASVLTESMRSEERRPEERRNEDYGEQKRSDGERFEENESKENRREGERSSRRSSYRKNRDESVEDHQGIGSNVERDSNIVRTVRIYITLLCSPPPARPAPYPIYLS